jgi:hypothetical protein
MAERDLRIEVRNPVLALPASASLLALEPASKAALRAVLIDLRDDARARAAEAAERILLTVREHSPECQRHSLGGFDKSGNCERCSAFLARNKAVIG